MRPRDTCPSTLPDTPLPVDNPPGLPSLRTRIGTFGSFRRTMLERIAVRSELAALTTRDPDDHAVALVEQWAVLADVLTFYGERYANEAYLGTATRDESLHRLVRLIGYRPRPGVSATTTLAFTLGARTAVSVPTGFAVQSVPGPGEEPQTFETLEDCAADWRFNSLPAFGKPVRFDKGDNPLTAPGGVLVDPADSPAVRDQVRPGDPVVLVTQGHGPDGAVRTVVTAVDSGPAGLRLHFGPGKGTAVFRPKRTLRVFGHDAPDTTPPTAHPDPSVPGGVRWDWGQPTPGLDVGAGRPLPLEGTHQDLAVGTWLLVVITPRNSAKTEEFTQVVTVTAVETDVETIAGVTAPVALVSTSPAFPEIPDRRCVRITELHGDRLPLLDYDYPATLGSELWIPGLAEGDAVRVVGPPDADRSQAPVISPADLIEGRRVMLADSSGHVVATALKHQARREPPDAVPGTSCHLVVPVGASPDETAALDAATTSLLGNAAAAGHGTTVPGEVLGSGDASATFQRFALAKGPLTRVPAPTPEGSVPALTVRVDGLAWTAVPELLAAGPEDEVFALRTEPDGSTTVQFGDSATGARPRTGASNLVAVYRHGAGLAGRVRAGSLTQALHRLPGVEAVVNPAAAQGGADQENATALRERAPGIARVLGRAVSAADCVDMLIATGLVAKASSATLWDGRGMLIAVTVAAPAGGTFAPASLRLLAQVVASASPPYRRVVVQDHVPVPVTITATVVPDPGADANSVLAAVRQALSHRLSFDRTALARPLHLSDLYLATSDVRGVAAVNITELAFLRPDGLTDTEWDAYLTAHGAGTDPLPERLRLLGVRTDPQGTVLPAELPSLTAEDLTVTLVAAPPTPTTGGLE
ncbi:baseplate J/gp47 family protein [Streptomyces durhamensis]|uniref:baseplate J/gp47 family protein n=1 Tax=Streptomyces durhamensis TaxID=68194 RepID=UPI0004CD11DC|nr:baseplate J/gp47 family protein [Streptomyces durhamensis]